MINLNRSVSMTLMAVALAAALAACQKQEGPAERAGKEFDKAAENVGQQLEKAGESIQDAAKSGKK